MRLIIALNRPKNKTAFLFVALCAVCLALSGCASLEHTMKCLPGSNSFPLCGL
jgi:hypothetical protein